MAKSVDLERPRALQRQSPGARELFQKSLSVQRFVDEVIPHFQGSFADDWIGLPDIVGSHQLGVLSIGERVRLPLLAEQDMLETMCVQHDDGEAGLKRDRTVIARADQVVEKMSFERERTVITQHFSPDEISLWDLFHFTKDVLEGASPVGWPYRHFGLGAIVNFADLCEGREQFDVGMAYWTDLDFHYRPGKLQSMEKHLNYGIDKARKWLQRLDQLQFDGDIDIRCRAIVLQMFRWATTHWGQVRDQERIPSSFRERLSFADAYFQAHKNDVPPFFNWVN